MSVKGGAYEREIAKLLSAWWSEGLEGAPRQDVFWRTENSGGRATTRGKKGLKTSGSHGDLGVIDPIGFAFLKVFTVEIKRGYSSHSLHSLLDKTPRNKEQQYEKWLAKADQDRKAAGTPYWLLIARRDGRLPLVFMPQGAAISLALDSTPGAMLYIAINGVSAVVQVGLFEHFLKYASPRTILRMAEGGH